MFGSTNHFAKAFLSLGTLLLVFTLTSCGDKSHKSDKKAAGTKWERVSSDPSVFAGKDDQAMTAVTAGGPGLVAVGNDSTDAAVWTSKDGLSWTRVPDVESLLGGEKELEMSGIAVGGPGLVAVGSDGSFGSGTEAAVWTSKDGLSWTRVGAGESVFGGERTQMMTAVAAGGPGLVAVGNGDSEDGGTEAAVWTSKDGLSWTRVPDDESVFGGERTQMMTAVAAGGQGLVAVGWEFSEYGDRDAAVWTSKDGLSWTRVVAVLAGESVFGGVDDQVMMAVAAHGPTLAAVGWDGSSDGGHDAAVWTSKDGLSWTRVGAGESVFAHARMLGIAAGEPRLVVVGSDGPSAAVWTYEDGLSWTRVPEGKSLRSKRNLDMTMTAVTAGGPGLVAIGTASSFRRSDAAVWTSSR